MAPRVTFGTPGWAQSGRGGAPGVAPRVTFGTPGWAQGFLLAPSNLTWYAEMFQNGRDSENKSWENSFPKDEQGMRT